ncbi:MAG: hypothetical protein SF029_12485 [bacterium]|nr:hypothetical protein [bacterium]
MTSYRTLSILIHKRSKESIPLRHTLKRAAPNRRPFMGRTLKVLIMNLSGAFQPLQWACLFGTTYFKNGRCTGDARVAPTANVNFEIVSSQSALATGVKHKL